LKFREILLKAFGTKPGYASITCSTISNIPYNLIFTTKFNDSSIHVTIWICRWRMNTLMTSQYQPMLSSITKILSRRISQSDCRIQIKLNCIYMIKTITVITFLCSSKFKDEKNARKDWRNQTGYQGYQKSYDFW
jgi:hypothetical protein